MDKKMIEFIGKAKKTSYASDFSVEEKGEDGGKSYRIEEGNLVYTDTYFGDLVDCGQELVYENGEVVWVMAYRGGIVEGHEDMRDEAFGFLKRCIGDVPEEFPARGPAKVEDGDWVYENVWEGNIDDFVGEENIYFKGEKICFRNYIGGMVKNK